MVLEKAIAAFQWRESSRDAIGSTAVAKDNVYEHIDAKRPDSKLNKCCQVFLPNSYLSTTWGCADEMGILISCSHACAGDSNGDAISFVHAHV